MMLGEGHESRPEQLRMADAVARTMEKRGHLLAEAGTGVGKSFAYLVPAMLRCLKGETVVIATHTIALQEQLVTKDIPFLMRAMGVEPPPEIPGDHDEYTPDQRDPYDDDPFADGPGAEHHAIPPIPPSVRPVLVKGRGNYVSIRRLELASKRQDRLLHDAAARRTLEQIERWAYDTLDGTLSSLPQLERPGVWVHVVSDSGNCMGRKCPRYNQCFFQRARRKVQGANLLVCNHALFFADLALRAQDVSILPRYDHVVLDEAHTAEDVAGEHFGVSLTEARVNFLLSNLHQPRGDKGFLPAFALQAGDITACDHAISIVRKAHDCSRAFFESLVELTRSAPAQESRPGYSRPASVLRLRSPDAVPNILSPVMRDLALRLKELQRVAKHEQDAFELNSYAQRAEMIAADADTILGQRLHGYAYWTELSGDSEDGPRAGVLRVELACAPVEVAEILRERLFRQDFSVTLTSATLATRTAAAEESKESAETAFAHLIGRLGCEGAETFQAGSPFDYAKQVRVYIPGGPPPALPGRPGGKMLSANESLAAHILHHVLETDGGAFVLFTSFSALYAVADLLQGPLAERRLPLLAQGRDGSRTAMLERFRDDDRSVLLGAASFWQGVDVRGHGLRNVIITKLPFDPPDRPLTQARNELIESRGGNPFMEDSLPRAVIKFKQGFGRLIRSKTDTGRVVVLDQRILTARYGRFFLNAMPPGVSVIRSGEDNE